ncbi:MAG: LamG domain-containing protein [Phycisphaerae bacterium]
MRILDRRFRSSRRGSALVLAVLVSVVITGLVLTIAWAAGAASETTANAVRLDQATMAAESAGQLAVWHFKNNNSWRQATAPSSLPTITIGSGTYTYALTCSDAGASATLYWPFDENGGNTTADTSGHNNTGRLTGGVSWLSPGKFGSALTFDGSSGYVDAGASTSTNITSSVTMAAWVRLNTAGNDQKVGGNQDGSAGGYKMSIYGLKVEFEVRDASNNPWLNRSAGMSPNPPGTILTMNTWYHVAGVYDAQAHTIATYVNGLPDRVPPDPACCNLPANALASTTGHFIMGREPWSGSLGSTRYFNGAIDDVRIYNRALSAAEIRTLADNSVHIHALASRQNAGLTAPSSAVDFICSAPTPSAPIAPALTVGGNLQLSNVTVAGDVQVAGNVNVNTASTVNGHVTYGGSFSDPHHSLTVTVNGQATSPSKVANSAPTLDYATLQSLKSLPDGVAGTGKTYTFTPLYDGHVPLISVNGDVTDPIIDTSQSAGTLLINGKLTFTRPAVFGSPYPVYIICENSCTSSNSLASLTLNGALYVKGNWTHYDANINGDVCITGSVTDKTVSSSSFTVGGIPWFDPRVNAAAVPQPVYYTAYQGTNP